MADVDALQAELDVIEEQTNEMRGEKTRLRGSVFVLGVHRP